MLITHAPSHQSPRRLAPAGAAASCAPHRPSARGPHCHPAATAGRRPTAAAAAAAATQPIVQELTDAARNRRSPEAVEAALLSLEQASKGKTRPVAEHGIEGGMRLVFSTSSSIRALQYIPVKEDLLIDLQRKTISLESAVGPVNFTISGVIYGFDEDAGALDFQFKKTAARWGDGKPFWEKEQTTTKRKTYTFFYANASIAAARSSQGGVCLLLRG